MSVVEDLVSVTERVAALDVRSLAGAEAMDLAAALAAVGTVTAGITLAGQGQVVGPVGSDVGGVAGPGCPALVVVAR
jgi:hypothetical protein